MIDADGDQPLAGMVCRRFGVEGFWVVGACLRFRHPRHLRVSSQAFQIWQPEASAQEGENTATRVEDLACGRTQA